jgi:2-oxoglutarate ferredoxin oxidoreductase subunit alpha
MQRLLKKWDTAKNLVPMPELVGAAKGGAKVGVIHFGSSRHATLEAVDSLAALGIAVDTLRIRGFPFHKSVDAFIDQHDTMFVVEQNRDAQMRTLLVNECLVSPRDLISILNYNGTPISARKIFDEIMIVLRGDNVRSLHKVKIVKESV